MFVYVVKSEILLVYFEEPDEVVTVKELALDLHLALFLLQKFDGWKCLNVLNFDWVLNTEALVERIDVFLYLKDGFNHFDIYYLIL